MRIEPFKPGDVDLENLRVLKHARTLIMPPPTKAPPEGVQIPRALLRMVLTRNTTVGGMSTEVSETRDISLPIEKVRDLRNLLDQTLLRLES